MRKNQRRDCLAVFLLLICAMGVNAAFGRSDHEEPQKTYTGGESLGIYSYFGQDLKIYIGAKILIDGEMRAKYFFDTSDNPNIISVPGFSIPDKSSFVEQETQVDVGFSYEDIIEARIRWEVQSFWDTDSEESPNTTLLGLSDEDIKNDSLLALEDAWASIRPFRDKPFKIKVGLQDLKLTHSGFLFFTDEYGVSLESDYDSFYVNAFWAKIQEGNQDRSSSFSLNGIRFDRLTAVGNDNDVYAVNAGYRTLGSDFRGYVLFDNDIHTINDGSIKNYFVGLSVASVAGNLTINGDLAAQFGKVDLPQGQTDRTISGYGGMLYGAYKLNKFKLHGTFAFGSGDSKANDDKIEAFSPLNQDLYGYFGRDGIWVDDSLPIAGIDEGGIFSNIGRDRLAGLGLMALNLGFDYTFMRKHQAFFDLSYFSGLTTKGLAAPTGVTNPAKDLGIEADLGVLFRFYRNFRFGANYAIFLPGGFFKDYYGDTTDEMAHNFLLETEFRF